MHTRSPHPPHPQLHTPARIPSSHLLLFEFPTQQSGRGLVALPFQVPAFQVLSFRGARTAASVPAVGELLALCLDEGKI